MTDGSIERAQPAASETLPAAEAARGDGAPAAPPGALDGTDLTARLRRALDLLGRALRGIGAERVQVRAMALTYISLFALAPALVVAFSVVQAFTGMERISAEVHEFLLQNLAVGARATIEPYLDRFVRNTHAARAGIVGAAFLLWSAYSLFSNVEKSINHLWEVQRPRSIRKQVLIYWMGVTLGPLVLAASATVSHVAQAFLASLGAKAVALMASGVLSSLFLTMLYLVVPSVRVRFRCALAGGVTAGIAWELAKWLFALFVAKFVRYSAIYGSVAAVPIFLTWIYLSWTIVLFGARLAFVVQNASSVLARDGASPTGAGRELLAGRAMVAVVRAFQSGAPAPAPEQVARSLRAGTIAFEVLEALRSAGLLTVLAGGGLVPARAPETITLLDVRRALVGPDPARDRKPDPIGAIIRQADEQAEERLALVTIRDLVEKQARDLAARVPPVSPPLGAQQGVPRASRS